MPLTLTILKVASAAAIIAFASWLSGKKPELAGFIIALPVASLIAVAFSYIEHRDPAASITFAKSILVAVPISYLFFLPFFLAERMHYGFWFSYLLGLLLLVVGFFIHRYIMAFFS